MTSDQSPRLVQLRLNGAIPRHIAIIMDGNGRWAQQQGLPRHDQVLTIDLVSPTMAYVKLKCAIRRASSPISCRC